MQASPIYHSPPRGWSNRRDCQQDAAAVVAATVATVAAAVATSAAAVALGRDDLGHIAPGKVADLLVLTRDPSDDIANLASLTHVVRAGSLHTRTTLVPD